MRDEWLWLGFAAGKALYYTHWYTHIYFRYSFGTGGGAGSVSELHFSKCSGLKSGGYYICCKWPHECITREKSFIQDCNFIETFMSHWHMTNFCCWIQNFVDLLAMTLLHGQKTSDAFETPTWMIWVQSWKKVINSHRVNSNRSWYAIVHSNIPEGQVHQVWDYLQYLHR